MTGTDTVLVVGAVVLGIKEVLAIYYSNKRAAAQEAKSDQIAAKVDATVNKVDKVAEVQAVVKTNTDGTLAALKASNDLLAETNRRQELIIVTLTAARAVTPEPLQVVTNGRTDDLPTEPIAVEVVNTEAVPVSVVPAK